MTIFIGSDHGGFELKEQLIEYLQEQNIRVEDVGAHQIDTNDDFPDFAKKVAESVLANLHEHMGILICRSGTGMAITANRFDNIYCGVPLSEEHVKKMREHNHVNILALPADYVDLETAKTYVELFLSTSTNNGEKYVRRMKKIDG
ncbi:MAG: RpiB/LacA/LacB family sugar-phosphate isomerase [Candidatus Roizmanbacteria bacterium]